MISFLIKKTLFDLWDNSIRIILLNVGFVFSLSIPLFISPMLEFIPVLEMAVFVLGILWLGVYFLAASYSLKAVSDYGSFGFGDFKNNLKITWPIGLAFGLVLLLGYLLCAVVIPFYLGMKSIAGLLLAASVFWILVVSVLALQFFSAIRARLDTRFIKIVKKCFIIFLDNPLFSIFALFHNMFLLAISVLSAFIFPGLSGVLLFLDEGLRLRLFKYDWLETSAAAGSDVKLGANVAPNASSRTGKNQIPWDTILAEEREKTGTRSLKNLIFPWKE